MIASLLSSLSDTATALAWLGIGVGLTLLAAVLFPASVDRLLAWLRHGMEDPPVEARLRVWGSDCLDCGNATPGSAKCGWCRSEEFTVPLFVRGAEEARIAARADEHEREPA